MQLRVAPENPLEWLALQTNQVPIPLLHIQMYFVMAKAVMEAAEAGADYVAFGAFFPTSTKNVEHVADLDTLQKWALITEVPCVAIGGINVDNAKPLIDAGADFLAVSGAVWNHPKGPAAAVQAFNALLA